MCKTNLINFTKPTSWKFSLGYKMIIWCIALVLGAGDFKTGEYSF